MSINVTLEVTPNPDTLKYNVSQPLLERGAIDFPTAADAHDSPLADRLFAVEGVQGVMIGKTFVTITVAGPDKMMGVNAAVPTVLKEHLEAGEPVFTGEQPASDHGAQGTEVAQRIGEVLDAQIRPAVAMDGGDVVFDDFRDGVVYLELKGSCAGCPSSLATLKMGIEAHLREIIPEVQEVVAV